MIVKQDILMNEIISLLNDTKEVVLKAKGRSMHPYIRDGVDSLVIQKTDPSTLRKGDMVLVKTTADHYVMHRIVGVYPEYFILKGDGNLFGTERCLRNDVIGKLAYVEKGGKRVDCNSRPERVKAYIMRSVWRAEHKTWHYIKKALRLKH